MSVLTVAGTKFPETMLDYQHSLSSSSTQPFEQHITPTDSALYARKQRQSHSPQTSSPQQPRSSFTSSHRHSRSTSSSALPSTFVAPPSASPYSQTILPNTLQTQSRHPSTSTVPPLGNSMSMHRQGTTGSTTSAPRRSTSSRSSTNSPSSYVALMRKQKATVWCDRSQNIDPRIAAAQRAAKQRATMEVHGGNNGSAGRTNTINSSGVVSKIRHGGVPKAPGYVPANLSGAGVPMRLSANEMLGDDEKGRSMVDNPTAHARTGSGRSSISSAKYRSAYPRADQGRFSANNTPPSGPDAGSPHDGFPDISETSGPTVKRGGEYFDKSANSAHLESEDSFGDLKEMTGPSAVRQATEQTKKAEDLKRRGSVDERAMSMGTGVRLFVANPDIED